MSIIKQLIRRMENLQQRKSPAGHRRLQQLNRHTLQDIGVNRMAAEYQNDEKLWQELAS